MAQKRNLNVSPYYDDFDSLKNFYKVLFKPGVPIQSRELTTLQSILQNQIESFGSHTFKEGSLIIPGAITYDSNFYAVKINSINFGVDVSVYINNFIGKKITGESSGITAIIQKVAFTDEPNISELTIYVKYVDSGSNYTFSQFEDGEALFANENVTYGNTTINAGTPFASLVESDSTSVGSAVSIDEGIYFVRGYFAKVEKQTILLDEYSNTPSYRVGLQVNELIVRSKDDSSLYDNAKGFSNYASPGADRLQINLDLTKKLLSDNNNSDFIEILVIENGKIKKLKEKSEYDLIRDYLAERTYEESGNYAIDPFSVSVHESLNDNLGNNGLFNSNETTNQGNIPTDDLLSVKLSPGKAYVKGYDVESVSTTILDVKKPRETTSVPNVSIPFTMGNKLRVNNVSGTPKQTDIVELYSQHNSSGVGIGSARVYNFQLTDAAYLDESSKWDLHLYDLHLHTIITLNSSLSVNTSFYIKGNSSGASGYVVSSSGNQLVLRQVSGRFAKGETISVNGISNSRTINKIDSYNIQDVKSAKSPANGNFIEFKADTFLEKISLPNGITNVVIDNTTLRSPGNILSGIKTDSIIRYQRVGFITETFNRVASVSNDSITLEAITDVQNIFNGEVLGSGVTFSGPVFIGSPIIKNSESASLYEVLPNKNISSIDFSNSNLILSHQVTNQSVSGSALTITTSDNSLSGLGSVTLSSFSPSKYSIHYNDGSVENLNSDSVRINAVSSQIEFFGLSKSDESSNVDVNLTLKKIGVSSKNKSSKRSISINVDKSQTGITTLISGLTQNNFYGLRVEDDEISLNYPDVYNIVAIYESLDDSYPILDKITFNTSDSIDTNHIIGENIYSNDSNAVARIISNPDQNVLEIVYLNSNKFIAGESVTLEETKLTAIISNVNIGKYKNITSNYTLDQGQREQYYDYSRIIRNNNSPIPSKKLKIIFDYYNVESTDTADALSVLSYDKDRYTKDIPLVSDNIRLSDTLDFRPRVSIFSSNDKSPFDFDSRSFSANTILTPNEDLSIGYDYYLGRVDKVYLDKYGNFILKEGTSGISPKSPVLDNDAMEIASIDLPPYLYNTKDSKISLVDNKRYTMRDIGLIEDRVENLEEVTSLSLLEVSAQTLQIRDSENRDRFKTGFFVDDFKNNSLLNKKLSKISTNSNSKELTPIISENHLKGMIGFLDSNTAQTVDFTQNETLLDNNVKKTGNLITLDYSEVSWIDQPIASKSIKINPFIITDYIGDLILSPSNDSWVRTIKTKDSNEFEDTEKKSNDVLIFSGSDNDYMRSRNVEFSATNLKPLTRYYQWFDGNSSVDFIPKLLEIENTNGTFKVGEKVTAYDHLGIARMTFRVAQGNHKSGRFDSPSDVFANNPYDSNTILPEIYNTASTILNIDTYSLSEESQGRYSGYLEVGMRLVGEDSSDNVSPGTATVKDLRLISDSEGDLIGSFFLRDPNISSSQKESYPRINSGTKTYRLISSKENTNTLDSTELLSFAETTFRSESILSRRSKEKTFDISKLSSDYSPLLGSITPSMNPLTQTFLVGGNIESLNKNTNNSERNGVFLTSLNLYFAKKNSSGSVSVEIRTVEFGIPTQNRIGKKVRLKSSDINISNDSTLATKVTFPEVLYLSPGKEYAIVITTESSDDYELWSAQMGEGNIDPQSSDNMNLGRHIQKYGVGNLFKPQNGSSTTPNLYEDLKFELFKAKFTSTEGTAFFYNPPLDYSNSYVSKLGNNPVETLPKTGAIGITTASDLNSILTVGTKLAGNQNGDIGAAYITGVGGTITTLGIITGGSNYLNDNDVETVAITGTGKDFKLQIQQTNGLITGITTLERGHGYKVGDIIKIKDSSVDQGSGAQFIVETVDAIDTLYLTGIQGTVGTSNDDNFKIDADLKYYNGNTIVGLADTHIERIHTTSDGINDGKHIKINHFNHGMYSNTNKVKLSDIESSYAPTILNQDILASDTANTVISVGNTSGLDTFEGEVINSTNPGYLKIGREIISYNDVGEGTITLSGRGLSFGDSSTTGIANHKSGDLVYKYELNGISLRRVNGLTTSIVEPIGIDHYHVSVDRGSSNGLDRTNSNSDRPQVSFIDDSHFGGNYVNATENILFTEILPNFPVILPSSSTSIESKLRTVSGTSVDGSEVSFIDTDYEPIELNTVNKLSSARIVCSEINENEYLGDMPRKKSLTTALTLSTTDENVSPIIYITEDTGTVHINPRLNNPVSDYSTNSGPNSSLSDPHAAIYVSNTINLKNPASSIKVILSAFRPENTDFRVLYKLIKADSEGTPQEFELFPGFDNLKYNDQNLFEVIDDSKNSGKPDVFVRNSKENEFLEYQFTANNLPLFVGFSIKIVMSGTNVSRYPKIKDLRSIAVR